MAIVTEKYGALEYLRAEGICVPHGFTTRLGGVSSGTQSCLNLNYGRGDTMDNVEKNLRILAKALRFDPKKYVMTRQRHTDSVRVVTDADCAGFCHRDYPICDALITNTPGVALLVFTADCTPILFYDPVTGAVGAAHAGWRGTAADIAGKTVRTMEAAFGCRPENIHAAIGPNIGPCCFETDWDVPQAMLALLGPQANRWILKRGEKFLVDLKSINARLLQQAGVQKIEISTACTMCQHERFWSHRYTRGDRGSQGAVICREVLE